MRIFHILEFNQFDTGSVHQMFQAAAGLRERGHDVTIVSRPGAAIRDRAERHGVRFEALAMRNAFDVVSARRLSRLLRGADVVHVHKGIAHSLALMATLAHPVGALVVNRGVSFPLDRWNRAKFRTRRVDRIVAVCEQIRQVIIDSGRLRAERVAVVYAGTDVHEFDPAKCDRRAFRREKGIPDDRFLVAQVGVRDWKGWKELIDAAAPIPNVHLALIGCRTDREIEEVRTYGGQRVTAVEVRSDMPNVFASCDLVVDASWAGTGITGTIREAMAMRKPVIATDCGGNRELVSSPEVGWLIPPKNIGALRSAISEILGDPARRERVAANARQHVLRGFSKELRITRLEELYTDILSRRSAARDPA